VSEQLRDKTGVDNRFIELIKYSKKVICLDANLNETTIELLDSIRGTTGNLVWNSHALHGDYNVYLRKFRRGGIDHILKTFEEAVVNKNRNVIGHINSVEILHNVANYLKEKKPDIKMKIYHGDDRFIDESGEYHGSVKKEDLKDVNGVWK
jgi:hypothetical protein